LTKIGTEGQSAQMAVLLKDLLREWRGKLRQKEAADKLEVPYATYRKWETGKRTPTKFTELELRRRLRETT
jgi:DNA-binding transcriptional regulator YiaG